MCAIGSFLLLFLVEDVVHHEILLELGVNFFFGVDEKFDLANFLVSLHYF